jgi:hypothetical protein
MALSITRTNCQKLIEAQLCGLPCGWKSAIASAICFAVTSSGGLSGYSGFSGAGGDGLSGISGYSGYSGLQGPEGPGASGYSGYSGNATSGYSGFSGLSGYSGFSGYSGANPGSSGFSGQSGFSGFSGANPGQSGYSGFSGANPGISGYSGYSGYSGNTGAAGASGFSGDASNITADNGLSKDIPTNIQLGGPIGNPAPLLHDSYINSETFKLVIQDNSATTLFQSLNAGSGVGIIGQSNSGIGIIGLSTSSTGISGGSTSAIGIQAASSSGTALKSLSTSGLGADININPATSAIAEIARFQRTTTIPAVDGIGGSIGMYTEDDSGNSRLSNQLISKWSTVATASRISQLDITGVNAAVTGTIMSVYGTGVVGIGISSVYTATRLNVVDNALAGGGLKMVNLTSTSTNSSTLLNVSATGSMAGIVSNTAAQVAITGQAVDATAISGTSTNGFGVSGGSTNSYAGTYTVNPASTNTIVPVVLYQRGSTGTAANNIGGSVQFAISNDSGGAHVSNEIISKWTDASLATRTSQFSITGVNSGTLQTIFTISAAGIFTLTQGLSDFADDTAAAVGLIPVNGLYRTASVVKIRVT